MAERRRIIEDRDEDDQELIDILAECVLRGVRLELGETDEGVASLNPSGEQIPERLRAVICDNFHDVFGALVDCQRYRESRHGKRDQPVPSKVNNPTGGLIELDHRT